MALALLPELGDALLSFDVAGWVAGLLTGVIAISAVVAGVAMITLGRAVRAIAWLAHRALEQDAAAGASTPSGVRGSVRHP